MKEIVINHYGTNYHLHFSEVYHGDVVSRFEVTAAAKKILLERRKRERLFQKRWKILSVNWSFTDKKVAAQFINEIMVQIDLLVQAGKDNDKNHSI
jgi:hypothetical protein